MTRNRLEAFSDGVIAIIITIMVLELKLPKGPGDGASFADLVTLVPVFVSYLLSFVYVGIYWNNHHHMFQAVDRVTGGVLWANLHFLFWLSLVPFATAWIGGHSFAPAPTAFYGLVLLFAAIAYFVMQRTIVRAHGPGSTLARAVGRDLKGKSSLVMYVIAIGAAFFWPWLSSALYLLVALLWLIPDRRIERALGVAPADRAAPV